MQHFAIYHSARCMGVSFNYSCSILQSIRCVSIGFMQHFAICQVCGRQFHATFLKNLSGVWASVSCSILQSIRCAGISFMQHFSIFQVCGRQFHAAQRLRNHMQSHIEGKNFCCLKCGKLFESQKRLDTHAIIHDAERREPFSCVDCGKVGYWCIVL